MTPEQELTEQDQADLADLYAEPSGGSEVGAGLGRDLLPDTPPEYHTILEVWDKVLEPAKTDKLKKISPAWAQRICSAYQGMRFKDMDEYRNLYFDRIIDLHNIVKGEIASDPECLEWRTPETDVEHNSVHYKNILMNWQKQILQWELDWNNNAALAHVDIAAISEVHKMFFSETGLTAFLDNIKFEYTEADQAQLVEVLEEMKAGVNGE